MAVDRIEPIVRTVQIGHDGIGKAKAVLHIVGFELGKLRVRVRVVEDAEELLLRMQITGGAVATDADANRPGAASLPLRLPDGMQEALAYAVEVAPRSSEVR